MRGHNPSPPRKAARSPLSRRDSAPRNDSPTRAQPSLDTVLVSDEELRPDDGLSPWNSDDSMGSVLEGRSAQRSRTGSVVSRSSRRLDAYGRGPAPQDFGSAENVVATLRLLVALEDYLGSLGPKIVDLLAEALKMEKTKANSSEDMLEQESSVVLIETAKEKLKGAVQAGLVASGAVAAVRAAVVRAAATLHEADKRIKKKNEQDWAVPVVPVGGQRRKRTRTRSRLVRLEKQRIRAAGGEGRGAGVPVAGVGEVDREQIAQQMAAALVAQGKTDVSAEELAQLVDAVVGMAEAKKRDAESKKKVEARAANNKSTRPIPLASSGTASALQMLQSAYDDKKIEKEDAPDAMDGLSDSDLETLLKNFNELSAEEQHSLIAYLKKLEAREPERVERLRQYVSAAATNVPPAEPRPPSVEPVTIESDDDDYTVEDVFKSATENIKEDRIRQEMEIVKKSLEETKAPTPVVDTPVTSGNVKVVENISSATDLLALVQAALKSTPAAKPDVTADVVTSNTQPRSFGDPPEQQITQPSKQIPLNLPVNQLAVATNIQNQSDLDGNSITQNEPRQHVPVREPRQIPDDYDRGPVNTQGHDDKYDQGGSRGLPNNFNQEENRSQDSYNQRSQGNNFNQGPQRFQNNYNQGSQDNYNQGSQDNYNQGSHDNYNQGTQDDYIQEPLDSYSQENQDDYNKGPQDNYNQRSRGGHNTYNHGSRGALDNYNQGSRGPLDNYNQGFRGAQDNYNQVMRGPQDNFTQNQRGPQYQEQQNNYNQNAGPPQSNFQQGSGGPQINFNQGPRRPQSNFNQNLSGPRGNFNQGPQGNFNQGPPGNFNQGPQGNFNQSPQGNFNQDPQGNFNQGPRGLDNYNRGGPNDSNYKNQGPRENFMGNRNQDTSNNQQQFGNQQKNFRGRGGGRGFGGQRGRGRGFF